MAITRKVILGRDFIVHDLYIRDFLDTLSWAGFFQNDRLRVIDAKILGTDQERASILIMFDIGTIPKEATITSATLNMFLTHARFPELNTTPIRRVIYKLLRVDWSEDRATWENAYQAVHGELTPGEDIPWGLPGAKQFGVDRGANALHDVTSTIDQIRIFRQFSLSNSGVQSALSDGFLGMIYERSGDDPTNEQYGETYASKENVDQRWVSMVGDPAPYLEIEYSILSEEEEMAVIPRIDYTSRDYEAIRSDLIRRLPISNPEYTDLNPSDFGVTLIELFSWVADNLHYQVDRAVAERFLDTMVLRSSAQNALKLIGTKLKAAQPARGQVTLMISSAITSDISIPKSTKFSANLSDGTSIYFETDAAATLSAGATSINVAVTEGETKTEDPVPGSPSNGEGFQEFTLSNSSYIEGTMAVTVTETIDEQWTEVSSLATQTASAKVFEVSVSSDGTPTIRFGDGIEGKIPTIGAKVVAVYRVGGGENGNVGVGKVDTVVSSGLPSDMTVTNASSMTGGGEAETLASARKEAPKSVRANDRAVTLEDFAIIAREVPNIAKAKARKNQSTINPADIEVIIAPNGGRQPTTTMIQDVTNVLGPSQKGLFGADYTVRGFTSVRINLSAVVVVKDNFRKSEVEDRVRTSLKEEFGFDTQTFGNTIRLSDIYRIIDSETGVDYADVNILSRVPEPVYKTWNGDSTFSTIEISDSTKEEEISVTFISSSEFKVFGTVSGVHANGTVNSPYISGNGEVRFTLQSGETLNRVDDRATFKTSLIVGNVSLEDDELATRGRLNLVFSGGIV